MPIADPLLVAMQAQYASQAAFHATAHQQAVLESAKTLQAPLAALALPAGSMASGIMPAAAGLLAQSDLGVLLSVHGGLATNASRASEGLGGSTLPAAAATARSLLRWQNETKAPTPAQDTAARLQRIKEDKAKKEADAHDEAERQRCHLHKRIKDGCKFCQRHKVFVSKKEEDKAALRDKFISDVRKQGRAEGRSDDLGDMRGPLDLINLKTFGFPPLLQSHIVESTHFKTLMALEQFEEISEEIYNFADTVEPYIQNSTTVPSALFCCVYRLLTMGIDGNRLRRLIESEESPFIRCAGFLFIRFGLAPDQFWPWLGEYVLDDEELRPSKDSDRSTTVGEYVEDLLTQDRYCSTVVLPRLPMSTKRQLEVRLAQVPQYRKRTQANQRLLDVYRQKGVHIEACLDDGDWYRGEVLELVESVPSRIKLRMRLDGAGDEATVHLGKVILTDNRFSPSNGFLRPRSRRSRSRSPMLDWARDKGKTGAELLDELRKREQDRAVCSSKSEYARRPVSFKVALPMEQGSASHRLIQDETAVTTSKRAEPRGRSRSPVSQVRSREHSVEYQARMRQLFEKYGMAKGAEADTLRQRSDIEGPDVMRLG